MYLGRWQQELLILTATVCILFNWQLQQLKYFFSCVFLLLLLLLLIFAWLNHIIYPGQNIRFSKLDSDFSQNIRLCTCTRMLNWNSDLLGSTVEAIFLFEKEWYADLSFSTDHTGKL